MICIHIFWKINKPLLHLGYLTPTKRSACVIKDQEGNQLLKEEGLTKSVL